VGHDISSFASAARAPMFGIGGKANIARSLSECSRRGPNAWPRSMWAAGQSPVPLRPEGKQLNRRSDKPMSAYTYTERARTISERAMMRIGRKSTLAPMLATDHVI
jgi:hypothetical protein